MILMLTTLSIHTLRSILPSLQQVTKVIPRLWRVSDRLSLFMTEAKITQSYISIPHATLGCCLYGWTVHFVEAL